MIERDEHQKRHDRFLYVHGIHQQVMDTINLARDLVKVAQDVPDQDMRDRLTRILNYSECWRQHEHLAEARDHLVELHRQLESGWMLGFQMAKALKPAIELAQQGLELLELEDTNLGGPAH